MRVANSYDSVVLGVSEQAAHDRRSGQMWEQVNMVSDPVNGLTRRRGSQYMNSLRLGNFYEDTWRLANTASSMKVREFTCNGVTHDVLYAKDAVHGLPALSAYDKTNHRFLPTKGSGELYDAIQSRGVAGMVSVGRFLFIAARGYVPRYRTDRAYPDDNAPRPIVVWIRNGDFGRKYTFAYTKTDGSQHEATYTTPSSAYPGKLDTSDIPVPNIDTGSNPDSNEMSRRIAKFNAEMAEYNKKVTARTNEYNSKVTQWVGSSTEAIQPTNIAARLKDAISNDVGAEVEVRNQYILIKQSANIKAGNVIDGGDGTYMRSVVASTDDPANLTPLAWYNMIIKIKSKKASSKESYYVRAEPKNSGTGEGDFGEVTWREYCGIKTVPEKVFAVATVQDGVLYVGSTPDELDSLTGKTDTPKFKESTVGDQVSAPVPAFMRHEITYLGLFQDRLLIGNGSTIFASRPEDYLNWFRQSVLETLDSDPVEMYALGSEDDVIHWDATFDRNHVLFGNKQQYLLPGRQALTPKNPTIQVMSSIDDAVEAAPSASGNFVFYAKDTATKSSLHQIQIGQTADSSQSYECSQQLDKYMRGKPCQILTNTSPFYVMVRTRDYHNGFYVYSYLDAMGGGQRLYDSWSRWEWDEALGYSLGISKWKGDILSYTVRNNSTGMWLVCDRFTLETDEPDYPLLDSWRPMGTFMQYPLWEDDRIKDAASVAYRRGHQYFMLGAAYRKLDKNIPDWQKDIEFLTFGTNFKAYYIPTAPYLRDRKDRAVLDGRLILSALKVTINQSGGLVTAVQVPGRALEFSTTFDGRVLGRDSNRIGRATDITKSVSIPVYKEIREFRLVIGAVDWLPMVVTEMEWSGQWFGNRSRLQG